MSSESVMPSNHLILCHPLLLPPSIFPSIRVFSNESVLCVRWPIIGASALVLPTNIQDWFPLGWTGWISLQSKRLKSLLQHLCSKASILRLSAFLYVLTLLYLNICLHWSMRVCFTSLEKRGPLRMFWLCSVCKDFERVVQGRSYCNYYNLIACSGLLAVFPESKI